MPLLIGEGLQVTVAAAFVFLFSLGNWFGFPFTGNAGIDWTRSRRAAGNCKRTELFAEYDDDNDNVKNYAAVLLRLSLWQERMPVMFDDPCG